MTDAPSSHASSNTCSPINQPAADVAATRWLAVGSLLALMALCVAWELWLAPIRPGGTLLFLKAAPLAFAVIGLLKRRMYTYRWMSLLVWMYFTEGVVRAWSDPAPSRWLALIEVALCVLLFIACAAHVRLRQKAAKAAIAAHAANSTNAATTNAAA
ncbi:DUF2069 domain-containing protein [Comamonas sp. Y33R10-2]|uniref:DUF2069 domain-containing protein n=1 Tax=Comamonas sp. Y33R10-2 TaxID=2853257 RepID=UPI001C5CB851|nr:DUF2069 domain-containing protein [Comamonas sp. Y33R10-2]QXZ08305.1 DUF2069 domain-containing protein [Comamonas sp. Y33R10-2]